MREKSFSLIYYENFESLKKIIKIIGKLLYWNVNDFWGFFFVVAFFWQNFVALENWQSSRDISFCKLS